MELSCNHKPTEHGWIQTYVNVDLAGEKLEPQHEKVEKSETTTVITEKSQNPN